MAVELQRLFSVDEYHRMARAGLFTGERVELLDGLIVRMPPLGFEHSDCHGRIMHYLHAKLGLVAKIRGPIALPLGDRSEPEPDVAVLANLPYARLKREPELSEVIALVEVSDTSRSRDTKQKRILYASFVIADYLVVDLKREELIHFSDPRDGEYASTRRMRHGETFVLAALPQIELVSDEMLPERK